MDRKISGNAQAEISSSSLHLRRDRCEVSSEYFGRIKFHAGKLCVTTPRELALGSSFVTGDVDKVQGAPTGRID